MKDMPCVYARHRLYTYERRKLDELNLFSFFNRQLRIIRGVRPSEILTRVQTQFGDETLSKTQVYEWHKRFSARRNKGWKMNYMIVFLKPPLRKRTYVQYVSFWRVSVALHLKKLLDHKSAEGVMTTRFTKNIAALGQFYNIIRSGQKAVVLQTCHIVRKVLGQDEFPPLA
ncbi:hypothetical protein NQ318_010884 [Aromia moschata]|uniref:Mos1 transposase HTH domain-containing protein n=1 Tax=Aromia moschata TaxID=1265417 RepID=A0AAV8XK16_9CUCU|nr:hypothetical protein NQ318_010884 [Aromia moschata]